MNINYYPIYVQIGILVLFLLHFSYIVSKKFQKYYPDLNKLLLITSSICMLLMYKLLNETRWPVGVFSYHYGIQKFWNIDKSYIYERYSEIFVFIFFGISVYKELAEIMLSKIKNKTLLFLILSFISLVISLLCSYSLAEIQGLIWVILMRLGNISRDYFIFFFLAVLSFPTGILQSYYYTKFLKEKDIRGPLNTYDGVETDVFPTSSLRYIVYYLLSTPFVFFAIVFITFAIRDLIMLMSLYIV